MCLTSGGEWMDCRLRCARRQLLDGYAGLSVVMVSSSFGDDIDCGGLTHFPPDGLRRTKTLVIVLIRVDL